MPNKIVRWMQAGIVGIAIGPAVQTYAQGFGMPPGPPTTAPAGGGFQPRATDPPSLAAATGVPPSPGLTPNPGLAPPPGSSGPIRSAPAIGGQLQNVTSLPNTAGQQQRVYDLRPYTGYLTNVDRPQQAVVDWVLRETGTDVWHGAPFGYLTADRDELTVYHTPAMQEVVSGIVDRFVAGQKDPQAMSLRVMTCGNPNWRSAAHVLMRHVPVQSPGLQAWLLTKENAAVVMAQLRARTDVRQVQAVDLVMHNGQSQRLASTRGRNYVMNVKESPALWPPYEPEIGEVPEGYKLEVSPLLSVDNRAIDCVVKAEIDQVDKLVPVQLDLPLPSAQVHRTKIDVPQLVSWRLHERFRWPSDMVLLLSCGVVASPDRPGSTVPIFNFGAITGNTAGRADALMFLEYRGRASDQLSTLGGPEAQIGSRVGAPNRGRY